MNAVKTVLLLGLLSGFFFSRVKLWADRTVSSTACGSP